MKPHWSIIRIALALAAIFTLGVVVGRLTTTHPTADGTANEAEATPTKAPTDLTKTGEKVMKRYQFQLDLSDEQLAALKDKFALASRRMAILPKQSRARLAVLEDFHEELDTHLTEAQRKIADEILENARAAERPR